MPNARCMGRRARGFSIYRKPRWCSPRSHSSRSSAGSCVWRCFTIGVFAWGVRRLAGLAEASCHVPLFGLATAISIPLAWSSARNGQATLPMAGLMMIAIGHLSTAAWWCRWLPDAGTGDQAFVLVLILLSAAVYGPMHTPGGDPVHHGRDSVLVEESRLCGFAIRGVRANRRLGCRPQPTCEFCSGVRHAARRGARRARGDTNDYSRGICRPDLACMPGIFSPHGGCAGQSISTH